jgi:branched-chain amino acid transport system substrate-binding protein
MKKILFTIIILFFVVACTQAPTGRVTTTVTTQESEPDREIVIGSIMPLSGDASVYEVPIQQAGLVALEEINNAGGINGKPLKIIFEDSLCTAKGGLSGAQKLISVDGVKVIIGGMCSGETLGAAPIAEENKVILFSPGSGSPDITNSGDYIFRNFPSDATSGSKVAKAAVANGDLKLAIISEQTDYAQAVKKIFKDTFVSEGGNVVVDELFNSDSSDFRTAITKMKNADPDALYVIVQSPARFMILIKQIRELGMEQQLYTNEMVAFQEILDGYSDEIEGAIYAEPLFDETAQESAKFVEKIKSRYGAFTLPPVYLATMYDAVYILKEALEVCGEDADCIKSELYSVRDRIGAAGKLSIDENGDAEFEYILKSIKNGEIVVEG